MQSTAPKKSTFSLFLWLLFWPIFSPVHQASESPALIEGINAIDDFTPQELVEDIFVSGACKNVFNITSTGAEESIGFFENGLDVIGLREGIVLATGDIENIEGPNDDNGRRAGRFGLKVNDPDLKKLAGIDTIMDAAILEFDFVPLDSLVTFRYVFASEEYCEYVDNVFNDVFGFFVDGPGINGDFSNNAINVALIPETRDFVSINSINHLRNENFFENNLNEADALLCGLPYTPTEKQATIQFDGFTKVLTATLDLIPCETYHLRLVVADVGDDSWDSAVFLEAESFNIGGELTLNTNTSNNQDTIPEGCAFGAFSVSRLEGDPIDEPISIGIRVSPNSGAREGVDFLPLPDSVTIPAGQESVQVPVDLIIDDQIEFLPESIILEFDFPCACIADTAKLLIVDPPFIETELRDTTVCLGDRIRLNATATGGVPGYAYRWSNGKTSSNIDVNVDAEQTYFLSITDACGRVKEESVTVRPYEVPTATIPNLVRNTCLGDTISVPITFTGVAPFEFTYALDGNEIETLSRITQNPYFLTLQQEGQLEIISYNDATCVGSAFGATDLRYNRIQTLAKAENVTCSGLNDGAINLEVVGGNQPYTFNWSDTDENIEDRNNLLAGLYQLTISDVNDCFTVVETEVKEPNPIRPISFECRALEADILQVSTSGGTPPYLFSVDGGQFQDNSIFAGLEGGASYTLTIQDAQGCSLEQSFTMPVLRQNIIELSGSAKVDLGESYTIRPKLNVPLSLIETIRWSPSDGLSCTDCLEPELIALEDQIYTVRIDDIFGCVEGAAITIKIDKKPTIFIPSAFSPDGNKTNDLLNVFANPNQVNSIISLKIFSRWGTLMYQDANFQPNEEDRGWDGKYNGRSVDPGLFIYIAKFELANGTILDQEGTVTIMK